MSRPWIVSRCLNDASLSALIGNRFWSSTRIREDDSTRVLTKPFCVYRMSTETSDFRGDDSLRIRRRVYQIFVHDTPGDYTRIDSILVLLEGLFRDVEDQANSIVRCEWLENSEDFRDDDMGTILRYCRIQTKVRET